MLGRAGLNVTTNGILLFSCFVDVSRSLLRGIWRTFSISSLRKRSLAIGFLNKHETRKLKRVPWKWNCVTACVVSYAAVLRVVTQRQTRLLRAWLRKCFNFLISSKPSLDAQNKVSMLSETFLNSRNEVHLARVSIFVHLVTDHIFIYPFILYRLFYFISFDSILFIIFYRRSVFFLLLFFSFIWW